MPPPDLTAERQANPAHELGRLLDAVAQFISGADPDKAAADHGISTTTLLSATETYHQAGRTALESGATTETWLQTHVEFTDWDHTHRTVADELAPRLDDLCKAGIARRWWFIRKHPHWRIRVQAVSPRSRTELANRLDRIWIGLAGIGSVSAWRSTVYEPESLAFGGDTGMSVAHSLFSADSRSALEYLGLASPPMGLRETSILLCTRLFHSAGLEWFEIGDVWSRVARVRPLTSDIAPERLATLTTTIKQLLTIGTRADGGLFSDGGPLHLYADWADAFASAGRDLRMLADNGRLHRGLRSVLAYHVIFHWNRIGLNAHRQTLITHAATGAILG